jgi:hypothetical protein
MMHQESATCTSSRGSLDAQRRASSPYQATEARALAVKVTMQFRCFYDMGAFRAWDAEAVRQPKMM